MKDKGNMKELLLIKLGGSVITDKSKPFTAKPETIFRLGREIKNALKKYKGDIIIAHGSGSFGHTPASKFKTHLGLIDHKSVKGLAVVADAAVQINRIVIANLLRAGLKVVSFSPVSFIFSSSGKQKSCDINPIKKALNIGVVPAVYGDIIFDEKKGFCIFSGEKVIKELASKLKSDYKKVKLILCVDTDGVYDMGGHTVSEISKDNFKNVKKLVTGSGNVDVTGGMLHKVEESLGFSKEFKTDVYIINGDKYGELLKLLSGKAVGTRINY